MRKEILTINIAKSMLVYWSVTPKWCELFPQGNRYSIVFSLSLHYIFIPIIATYLLDHHLVLLFSIIYSYIYPIISLLTYPETGWHQQIQGQVGGRPLRRRRRGFLDVLADWCGRRRRVGEKKRAGKAGKVPPNMADFTKFLMANQDLSHQT